MHHKWRLLLGTVALVFACLSNALVTPPLLHAQPSTTVPLAEYVATLEAAAELLAADPSATRVQAIQQQLNAITEVTLPGGTVVTVQPLLDAAAAPQPTAATIAAQLTLVVEQIRAVDGDDAAARLARLRTIFEGAAFVQQESLWQRFWRWLRSWLPDLPADEANGQPRWFALGATWIGYLLIGIGALLFIYLLSLWLQNLLGSFVGGAANGRRLTPDGALLNAAAARQQAHALASSGSFRAAVRQLYLSALLTLDERDLLHYDQSNTNREVLSTVRDNPALHQRLRPVIETFDDVWYGVHEPDQTTFDRYVQAVEQLSGDWDGPGTTTQSTDTNQRVPKAPPRGEGRK
jgi:hypothetical protein